MKKSKKKKKEVYLPMKWNVALNKFEPDLPDRSRRKKMKNKIDWRGIIILLLILLLIIGLIALSGVLANRLF